MRSVVFHKTAFDQFSDWATLDIRLFERLARLITETRRDPFVGIGKPEPLRGELKGCWSRRITAEHRLVYQVSNDFITIISCRDHY